MLLSGPVSATVLLAVPLGLLLLAASGRAGGALFGAGLLALALVLPRADPDGIAFATRGWALLAGAWLLVLTALAPRWSVLRRSLVATLGAVVTAAAVFVASGGWPALEAALDRRLHRTMASAGALLRQGAGEIAAREALDAALLDAARLQSLIFPAALGLATLASLGLAGALLARSRSRPGLGPLREFRFGDGLVWLLVGGLAALVLPLGAVVARLGANMVAFMAGLYALRGLAVVIALWAGAGPMVWIAGAAIGVLLYPLAIPATVMIGLGDTWLDLRARAAARANEE